MKKNSTINEGGINGLGESLVNHNSSAFKALKEAITARSKEQSKSKRIENELLSLRFQMETYLSNSHKETIVPAGRFIEQMLEKVGVSKKKFSNYIGYDYSNLISVLKGRRKVNPDLAMKVGKIFGIDPAIWLHIESKNELSIYRNSNETDQKYSLVDLME
jgi:plasmid maintenance system antidote protein VapI